MSDTPVTDMMTTLCSSDSEYSDLQAYHIAVRQCEEFERTIATLTAELSQVKAERDRMRDKFNPVFTYLNAEMKALDRQDAQYCAGILIKIVRMLEQALTWEGK